MTEQAFDHMRRSMVSSQLRTTGVNDPRVASAMGAVSRERFVPEREKSIAYADRTIPLGNGRELNSPMAIGRLLTEARLQGDERVLVIGAATGYSAAVLDRLAGEVIALEEDEALAAVAKRALSDTDVSVVKGPLVKGYANSAPYDFILIDGAVEFVPEAIIEQLGDGAELAVSLLDKGVTRLCIGRRTGGGFGLTAFADAAVPVLPGFIKPCGFSF